LTSARVFFVPEIFPASAFWFAASAAIVAFCWAMSFWSAFCFAYASDSASADTLGGFVDTNMPPKVVTARRSRTRRRRPFDRAVERRVMSVVERRTGRHRHELGLRTLGSRTVWSPGWYAHSPRSRTGTFVTSGVTVLTDLQ